MIAFEIRVNGELRNTIAVTNGAISAAANWSSLEPLNDHVRVPNGSGGNCYLTLTAVDSNSSEWMTWPMVDLSIGDQVEIRIVKRDESDPPGSTGPIKGQLRENGSFPNLVYDID